MSARWRACGTRIDRLVAIAIAIAVAAPVTPVFSHHSFALFQMDKSVTVAGTVKEFQWTNPHTWIVLAVEDGKGGSVEWRLEGASLNELTRAGWSRRAIAAGDRITVQVRPLRNGGPGGSFSSVQLADGRSLGEKPRLVETP